MVKEAINLGDSVVFEEIYRMYYPSLRFFAAKYVGEEESEDIVEKLFFAIWKKKKVLINSTHLRAFLYQSTKNACLDFIKIQGRKEQKHAVIEQQADAMEQDHLHDIIHTEVVSEVFRAINNLPAQCRKVVHLEFVDGLTNEEIAKELALSIQTVKNHKVRALKILKQQFAGNITVIAIINSLLS